MSLTSTSQPATGESMPQISATEQTPLFQNGSSPAATSESSSRTDAERQSEHDDGDGDGTSLAEDPSTAFLLAVNGTVWIGVFFAALDTTVVATLTGPISNDFNSLSLLSWLATGYLIANSACQPLSGKLTDIFGRRAGLLFSNFFFGAGTLICGLAPNAEAVIAGRVIAGIGGGGLTCIATFVQSDLVPLRQRGLWQGFGNIVFGLGMGLGGVFGGLCADKLSWRWAFLLQVPFIVVGTILTWFLLDLPTQPKYQQESSAKLALKRIDFLGAGLLVISLVLLLLGLNTGGNQLPWNHPFVISSIVLSALGMAAFLYVESTPSIVAEPIIPVSLIIRTRTVWAACMANWFTTMSAFLALYFVPLYLQVILKESLTAAGLRVIPFAIGTSAGSLLSGLMMRRTGKYYLLLLAFTLLYTIGAALLCTFTTATPAWSTYIYVAPMGLGYGALITITLVGMISATQHDHQATITAASYAFRSTGSTLGITIASAVFLNLLTTGLQQKFGHLPGSQDVIDRIRKNLDEIDRLPPSTPGSGWDINVVREVYMHAFRGVFGIGLAIALLGLMWCLLMREHVLYKNLQRK